MLRTAQRGLELLHRDLTASDPVDHRQLEGFVLVGLDASEREVLLREFGSIATSIDPAQHQLGVGEPGRGSAADHTKDRCGGKIAGRAKGNGGAYDQRRCHDQQK